VTLVDHDRIGWKCWKLIAWTINPTSSLFVAHRPSTYSQGNMGKFWGDYRGGVGKSGVLQWNEIKKRRILLKMAYGVCCVRVKQDH